MAIYLCTSAVVACVHLVKPKEENDKTTTFAFWGNGINLPPSSTSLSDAAAAAHSQVVPEHPVDPGPLIGPTPPASAPSAPPITSHSFTCNHHDCLPRRSQPLASIKCLPKTSYATVCARRHHAQQSHGRRPHRGNSPTPVRLRCSCPSSHTHRPGVPHFALLVQALYSGPQVFSTRVHQSQPDVAKCGVALKTGGIME